MAPIVSNEGTFAGINTNVCQLVVPSGSKASYISANYWKEFKNITEEIFYRVNFIINADTFKTELLLSDTVSAPLKLNKTGYTFNGWYKDKSLSNPWNFKTDLLTSDTTLYANWNINSYSVCFMQKTDSGNLIIIKVNYDSLINQQIIPIIDGYTFAGWYEDTTYTKAWNFATDRVVSNTILFPKWMAKVIFNTNGGSLIKDTLVNIQSNISQPKNPTKKGYVFAGWYKDSALTSSWNFSTDSITINTTIYAKWSLTNSIKGATADEVCLYPNPVEDFIILRGSNMQKAIIYDFSGIQIMKTELYGKDVVRINMDQLKTGHYFIKVFMNDSIEKIIKFVKK